jgi:hypothetical protein|tara:strand:- start:271 stop:540 length:270 start_codon:yes stop_codon:yes gene_type:complete
MRQSSLEETQKTNKRLDQLEKENQDLKKSISILTDSLALSAKSLEEISFIQRNHLIETESLMIVINDISSLLSPKNDYLKYDLLNGPHN